MPRKTDEIRSNTSKEKMLVNIGEHRKGWLEAVAGAVEDGSVTETMKCIVDSAAVEDPESYAGRVLKWRTKAQLEEIEREEQALQARKAAVLGALEHKGEFSSMEGR